VLAFVKTGSHTWGANRSAVGEWQGRVQSNQIHMGATTMHWLRRVSILSAIAVGTAAALSTQAVAQGASEVGPARLGLLGGVNLAKVGGDNEMEDVKNRMGVLLGATFVKPMTANFSLELDALYSMKGFKQSEGGEDATFKVNYLEIPILARIELGKAGAASPHLYAGPAIGLRIGCEAEFMGVSVKCDEFDDEEEIKSLDFGAMLGGGVDVPMGNNTFTVGVRYTLGLAKISEESDAKNRAIGLYAGFSMPLKR